MENLSQISLWKCAVWLLGLILKCLYLIQIKVIAVFMNRTRIFEKSPCLFLVNRQAFTLAAFLNAKMFAQNLLYNVI